MSPALKVNATYVDYHVVKCVTPPYAEALTDGKAHPTLEVALDDYHFTDHDVQYTYYDPEKLVVSAVDPIGGPIRGGTPLVITGAGLKACGGNSCPEPPICIFEVREWDVALASHRKASLG